MSSGYHIGLWNARVIKIFVLRNEIKIPALPLTARISLDAYNCMYEKNWSTEDIEVATFPSSELSGAVEGIQDQVSWNLSI